MIYFIAIASQLRKLSEELKIFQQKKRLNLTIVLSIQKRLQTKTNDNENQTERENGFT